MRSSGFLVLVALLVSVPAGAEPMIGPAVGNADLLVAEGMRLYNEKQYAQARDGFLKATRAAPATVTTYLSLARAWIALGELEKSCQAYKVFVRSAPDSPDRDKAESELSLCERRLAAANGSRELGRQFVSLKASFFEALDGGRLAGPASAAEHLRSLIAADYAAPDLGDMAGKLAAAASKSAGLVYEKALKREQRTSPTELTAASDLYQLALDCGAEAGPQPARIAFLQGMALLLEGNAAAAEPLFEKAGTLDPTNKEALFNRGLARYLAGDKPGALRALRAGLPDDPRTAVLELSTAFERDPTAAAEELERLLFSRRFGNGK